MDYMTFNQLSNAFKNLNTSQSTTTYRKPNTITLGSTPIKEPASVNLSSMYSTPLALPTATPVQYWQPPAPATQQPTTGYQNTESYLESTGLWQQYRDRWGNGSWMPTAHEDGSTLQTGDIYEQSSGVKYVWNSDANAWLLLKRVTDPNSSVVYWTYSDNQPYVANTTIDNLGLTDVPVEYENIGAVPVAPDVGGYESFWRSVKYWNDNLGMWDQIWSGLISNYGQRLSSFVGGAYQYRGEFQAIMNALADPNSGDIQGTINKLGTLANKIKDTGNDPYKVEDSLNTMAENLSHMIYEKDFVDKNPGITSQEEWNASNDNRPDIGYQKGYRSLGRIESWQNQLENLMSGIQSGDISYIDQNGLLDTSALRKSDNIWGNWMADVLDKSQDTGVIGDFLIKDESGNLQLSSDMQTLLQHYNDVVTPEQQRNMKNMRLSALQSGRSVYDPYYSDTLANYISDRSAEVADNVSKLMSTEMSDQYSYIMNSFKSVLAEAAGQTQAETFASQMNNMWTGIMSDYQMGLDQLAQQVAENNATSEGQTWGALIGFIANLIGAIL